MVPVATQLKIFPSTNISRPKGAVYDLACMHLQIDENRVIQMIQYLGMFYGGEQITLKKEIIKPEKDLRNPQYISGCTVRLELSTNQFHEVLRVHMYESQKIELPQHYLKPIIVNFIGHESAPLLLFSSAAFLQQINL